MTVSSALTPVAIDHVGEVVRIPSTDRVTPSVTSDAVDAVFVRANSTLLMWLFR